MKKFLKTCINFWINKTKQIAEHCIDIWLIELLIFELIICPFMLFIVDDPTLLLIIWISSFGLWYPTIKMIENDLKKEDKYACKI